MNGQNYLFQINLVVHGSHLEHRIFVSTKWLGRYRVQASRFTALASLRTKSYVARQRFESVYLSPAKNIPNEFSLHSVIYIIWTSRISEKNNGGTLSLHQCFKKVVYWDPTTWFQVFQKALNQMKKLNLKNLLYRNNISHIITLTFILLSHFNKKHQMLSKCVLCQQFFLQKVTGKMYDLGVSHQPSIVSSVDVKSKMLSVSEIWEINNASYYIVIRMSQSRIFWDKLFHSLPPKLSLWCMWHHQWRLFQMWCRLPRENMQWRFVFRLIYKFRYIKWLMA